MNYLLLFACFMAYAVDCQGNSKYFKTDSMALKILQSYKALIRLNTPLKNFGSSQRHVVVSVVMNQLKYLYCP